MNKTAKELVKLGHEKPELREHIRPVLDELTGKTANIHAEEAEQLLRRIARHIPNATLGQINRKGNTAEAMFYIGDDLEYQIQIDGAYDWIEHGPYPEIRGLGDSWEFGPRETARSLAQYIQKDIDKALRHLNG